MVGNFLTGHFHVSAFHTIDMVAKTVAGLKPQLKGYETHLKSLIFHQMKMTIMNWIIKNGY